jgi:hypothetical protein
VRYIYIIKNLIELSVAQLSLYQGFYKDISNLFIKKDKFVCHVEIFQTLNVPYCVHVVSFGKPLMIIRWFHKVY